MIYRPQFFSLEELVCPDVYKKHGEMAWQFFDEKAVITIDLIRRMLGKGITVNTWHNGGTQTQRGLRCNLCSIVKEKTVKGVLYVSAHMLGKGFDFDVEGMTADEVRVWIAINKEKLPYNIRLEEAVNWIHFDVEDTGKKISFFKG